MIPLPRIVGVVIAAVLVLGMAAASGIPVRVHPTPDARLRVAFSARPERIESCRALSQEELAGVPEHMRQSVVCEGTTARYRLEIVRDDSVLAAAELHGGGLRRDRQLYVLRQLDVPSGLGSFEVRLSRLDSAAAGPDGRDGSAAGGDRESEERRRRKADEVPASLTLRETITLAPREVLLVTYDQQSRRLRTVRGTR